MSRRRTRSSTKPKASEAYYVGYVEDEETPEMIMRKFAALEEIQAEQQKAKWQDMGMDADSEDDEKAPVEGLTEESMKKLFVETSAFSMDMAAEPTPKYVPDFLVNNAGDLMTEEEAHYFNTLAEEDADYALLYGDVSSDGGDWSDTVVREEDDLKDEPRKRRRKPSGTRRSRPLPQAQPEASGISMREYGDHTVADNKKHVDFSKSRLYKSQKHPMVSTFAYYIKPYKPELEKKPRVQRDGRIWGGALCSEANIYKDTEKLLSLAGGKPTLAVWLNVPWTAAESDPGFNRFTFEDFKKIEIPTSLMPVGIVFVYVPKMYWHRVWKHMEAKGYYWVEEALVVNREPNYRMKLEASRFFGVSRMSLQLFRRKAKGKLPMHHQRVTNVHFLSGETKDEYTYDMIEQMFPHGKILPKGARLVELFSRGHQREGWAHILHKE